MEFLAQRAARQSRKQVTLIIQSRIITEKAISANLKRSLIRDVYDHLRCARRHIRRSCQRAIDVHKRAAGSGSYSNQSYQIAKRTREFAVIAKPTNKVMVAA